jgi:hypothetical protein
MTGVGAGPKSAELEVWGGGREGGDACGLWTFVLDSFELDNFVVRGIIFGLNWSLVDDGG